MNNKTDIGCCSYLKLMLNNVIKALPKTLPIPTTFCLCSMWAGKHIRIWLKDKRTDWQMDRKTNVKWHILHSLLVNPICQLALHRTFFLLTKHHAKIMLIVINWVSKIPIFFKHFSYLSLLKITFSGFKICGYCFFFGIKYGLYDQIIYFSITFALIRTVFVNLKVPLLRIYIRLIIMYIRY